MEGKPIRTEEPPELLAEMHAHVGLCRHCGGIVKMARSQETGKLMPDSCHCFFCGQRYFMEIADIDAWEAEQWDQKATVWQ